MPLDPLAVATVPADEQWDESLDVLAQAVARDMSRQGLLREQAEVAARYHIRSFARRLVNPLLDQVHTEIRAGQQEAVALRRENARLRARLAELGGSRRHGVPISTLFGGLWTLLVLTMGMLLYSAWSGTPRASTPVHPVTGSAVTQPATLPSPLSAPIENP